MNGIEKKISGLIKDSSYHFITVQGITSMSKRAKFERELKIFLSGLIEAGKIEIVMNDLEKYLQGDKNRCNIVNGFIIKNYTGLGIGHIK